MNPTRILRHLTMTHWRARRVFPSGTLEAIEQAVRRAEQTHRGEIRVAIEAALHTTAVLADQTPRQRAEEVFTLLHVWDTEYNNGVLIYVLLADRAVELVADRGLNSRISTAEWQDVCRMIEQAFRNGQFEQGTVRGVEAVAGLLARHFAPGEPRGNELPDRPAML